MCTNRNCCGSSKICIIDGNDKNRVFAINDHIEKKNIALSKMKFAENIFNGIGDFSDFSYKTFAIIFDIIKEILSDT